MTGRKSYEPQKCIPVINDFLEEKFAAEPEEISDENLNFSTFSSIWKAPERLSNGQDYSLLLAILSREIHAGNFHQPLLICRFMKKNARENQEVDKMFTCLFMLILRDEKHKKIDPHIMLSWIDTGDRLFSGENLIRKQDYAILKFYFLCRNRKSKLECFPCGCMQKYFIEFYLEDSSKRLVRALNSLMNSSIDLPPVLKRLFKNLLEITSLEYFEYYIELLGELQACSVIDKETDSIKSLVQLIGLLCLLKSEEVPHACSKLYGLIKEVQGGGCAKKSASTMEMTLRRALLPKIFDSISRGKMDLNRASVMKMVELIISEKYSYAQQANVFFAPLQLLNKIFSEFDAWEKLWPLLKKDHLDSAKFSPITVLYFLSLIYRNDSSLICHLVEYLEQQYQIGTIGVKETILILLEIMEKLADSNPGFQSFFKENHLRNRLLLESELSISIQYLEDFSVTELNRFLEQKTFTAEEFENLMEKIKNFEIPINSERFWRVLMEKLDGNAMIFVEKQLRIMVDRKDRKMLNLRIDQIFKRIKETKSKSLMFPGILLELTDSEYSLLPSSTTPSLISLLVSAFCSDFEENELKITRLLRKMVPDSAHKKPLELIEEIIEKNRNSIFDVSGLKEIFDDAKNPGKRERTVEICSILFEKQAAALQKLGDGIGNTPYCIITTIIDNFIEKGIKEEIVANPEIYRRVCERAINGFAMYTEKWNVFLVLRKTVTLLNYGKREPELLRKLMKVIQGNEALHTKLLKNKKEFVQLEQTIHL